MELTNTFKSIKEEFCSLWQFKERGESLEIITPYSTTSNKFVSVFIGYKNKEYIVSDGGWLSSSSYESSLDLDDDMFNKVFTFYENHYEIKNITANGLDYYYKKTTKQSLIPALVYDLANFISAVSSSAQIQFQDAKEKEEKRLFEGHARGYLSSLVPKNSQRKLYFRKSLSEDLKSVKFSAISEYKNNLTLINYVTGSTVDYFISSIGKANITFEVADNSPFKKNVKNKIALINDKAKGYDKPRLFKFLERLESTTGQHNIFWHQKERLKQYI